MSGTESQTNLPKGAVHLKSILVPTDFSEESFKALDYAVALAEVFGAKITLAHVLIPVAAPDFVYGPVVWDESAALEGAKKRLHSELEERLSGKGIPSAEVVETGHPYHEIDRLAKEIEADLIIVSTHGHAGLKHLLLGSVAEKVIRHAPCPVLVVREKEHEFVGD